MKINELELFSNDDYANFKVTSTFTFLITIGMIGLIYVLYKKWFSDNKAVRVTQAEPNWLKGPYKEIGKGGFGAVYECRYGNKPAVLKLCNATNTVGLYLTWHEATQLSVVNKNLKHPNIVTFLGVMPVRDGAIYQPGWAASWLYDSTPKEGSRSYGLIMEYIEGKNLRQYLESFRITPREKLDIVKKITDGLKYIHRSGLVHQDLKSDNILMTKDGKTVKIADFGVARYRKRWITFSNRTIYASEADGFAAGTWIYIAPEVYKQVKRLTSDRAISCQSDIFSLGLLIWEIATGHRPFRSEQEMAEGTFKSMGKYQTGFFTSIIRDCIKPEKKQRPTADDIFNKLGGIQI